MVPFGFKIDTYADESTKHQLELVKRWACEEGLPSLVDEQIYHFFVRWDGDVSAVESALKTYYHLRAKAPSVFAERKLEKYVDKMEIFAIPERTQDGCGVLFARLVDTNYRTVSFDDYFKLLFMTVDGLLHAGPLNGLIAIFDLDGISLMHLTKVKISLLRMVLVYIQDALPVKMKATHCINTVSFIETIMKMLRPVMKAEMLANLHFHPRDMDLQAFHAVHVDKRCLPSELGGEQPSTRVLYERQVRVLADLHEHFDAEERQRETKKLKRFGN